MSTPPCCKKTSGRKGGKLTGLFSGIVPGILLVLVPKCPLCLAAYVSLGTGIGISFATARVLRILLLVCSISSLTAYLLFFVGKRLRKYRKKPVPEITRGDTT